MAYKLNVFTGEMDYYESSIATADSSAVRLNMSPLEEPDGITPVFSTPEDYVPGSLMVFVNGQDQPEIEEIAPNQWDFGYAPAATDVITLIYAVAASTYSSDVTRWKVKRVPNESPNGILNVFTTPDNYVVGTLQVLLNGLNEEVIEIDSTSFSFYYPPAIDDKILLSYLTT